jgi:hypothetical protein
MNNNEPTTGAPYTGGGGGDQDAAATLKLQHLRRLIREQFAGAVSENRLDIDLANGMLEVLGLPAIPRRWDVTLTLTFTCEVTAEDREDAFEAAGGLIAAALLHASGPVDVHWDTVGHDEATPGQVDHDAFDRTPLTPQTRCTSGCQPSGRRPAPAIRPGRARTTASTPTRADSPPGANSPGRSAGAEPRQPWRTRPRRDDLTFMQR